MVLASGARIAAVAEQPTREALETLVSLPPDEQTKVDPTPAPHSQSVAPYELGRGGGLKTLCPRNLLSGVIEAEPLKGIQLAGPCHVL